MESHSVTGPSKDDTEGWNRKQVEWGNKTDKLLYEISKDLNIKVNPLDIQVSYYPDAWFKEQKINYDLKEMLIELLDNKRALNIRQENMMQRATLVDDNGDDRIGLSSNKSSIK